MASELIEILDDFDILVLSGGVSKGKYDYVPEVLAQLEIVKAFHGVLQRPGKPFWYGKINNKRVFALPGNPMSTLTCCLKYLLPYHQKAGGYPMRKVLKATLTQEIIFKPKLTRIIESLVRNDDSGNLLITPIDSNGSGDFTALIGANAMIELPGDKSVFKKGETVSFFYINQ